MELSPLKKNTSGLPPAAIDLTEDGAIYAQSEIKFVESAFYVTDLSATITQTEDLFVCHMAYRINSSLFDRLHKLCHDIFHGSDGFDPLLLYFV